MDITVDYNKEVETLAYRGPRLEPIMSLVQELNISQNLSDDMLEQYTKKLYEASISSSQSYRSKKGRDFEEALSLYMDQFELPYIEQVAVNKGGTITGWKNCKQKVPSNIKRGATKHRIDFVVGKNISIGDNISDYIIISAKVSLRDRYRQESDYHNKAKKFYMCTLTDEPVKDHKIILVTSKPNKRKNRNTMDYNKFFKEEILKIRHTIGDI